MFNAAASIDELAKLTECLKLRTGLFTPFWTGALGMRDIGTLPAFASTSADS